MSRIGKQPITINSDVSISINGDRVLVKGPKGELGLSIPEVLSVKVEGRIVTIVRQNEDRTTRALHGLFRSEVANAIHGVTVQWSKTLELSGVGYRATTGGQALILTIGLSHPVSIIPPPGITLAVVEGNIVVTGVDKRVVGETAATIRTKKKPEPYKGKGIKYEGERIRRKAGKSAKAVGGAPGAK